MYDFQQMIHKAAAFPRATFGAGERTESVIDHMTKEFEEIRKEETASGRAGEWVDQVILSIDGLTRALQADNPDANFKMISMIAESMIEQKYCKNELRDWPDWRTADLNKAIEHVRGTHD